MRNTWLFWLIASFVVLFDRLTKWLVLSRFSLSESIEVIPDILWFTRIHNTGVAFGLGQGLNWVFVIVAVAVIVYLTWNVKRMTGDKWLASSCGLILGGAVGNLVDRLLYGYVVDFVDVHWFPAFNVADSALSIAAVVLAIYFWKKE